MKNKCVSMAIKPYCTFQDVVNLTGFRYDDMDFLGAEMTLEEYQKLVKMFISASSNMINRYCNVKTFYTHQIVDEYHTINNLDRYSNNFGLWRVFAYNNDYPSETEYDHLSTLYPREQPVKSIDKVEINLAQTIGNGPKWVKLEEYGSEYINEKGDIHIGRDYQIIERFDTTSLKLVYNLPAYGKNNVKITYSAGYDEDSDEIQNIRLACAMMVNNYLIYKKKNQEVATIRGSGISDYAPMFNDLTGGMILTPAVLTILNMYRRQPLDPSMYE